ncbi:MAG: transposase, partial [Halioglobus sp.]|nr:transposase [Halioglobus sp.]
TSLEEKPLLHFETATVAERQRGIPFSFKDYLALMDWTARQGRTDKSGAMARDLPPLLSRMDIPPDQWLLDSRRFEDIFHRRFRLAA